MCREYFHFYSIQVSGGRITYVQLYFLSSSQIPKEVDPDILCLPQPTGDQWCSGPALQLHADPQEINTEQRLCGKHPKQNFLSPRHLKTL